MRIESKARIGSATARGASHAGQTATGFRLEGGAAAAPPAATAVVAAAAGIDALLALQAVEDPAFRRRKQVRRATGLLDALEELQADLLAGGLSEERLGRLSALIGAARERTDVQLDALIDDIELRVQVELAKRGIYVHS